MSPVKLKIPRPYSDMKTYDVYFENEDTGVELKDSIQADEIVQAMSQANKLVDELNKKFNTQDVAEYCKFKLMKITCRD